MILFKPFLVSEGNDHIIHLPPLFPLPRTAGYSTDYLESYVFKVTTFTPDPVAYMNDVICVAILGYSRELVYIRPATENKWIRVTGTKHISFHDVVYYNNQFYALTREGKLFSFEISYNWRICLISAKSPRCRKRGAIFL